MTAPHSLYCGFENAIEVFDVGRPGEEGFRMHTTPTRSSRQGQKGQSRLRHRSGSRHRGD